MCCCKSLLPMPVPPFPLHRQRLHHPLFERISVKLLAVEPPCMSDAEDWERSSGWVAELELLAQQASWWGCMGFVLCVAAHDAMHLRVCGLVHLLAKALRALHFTPCV